MPAPTKPYSLQSAVAALHRWAAAEHSAPPRFTAQRLELVVRPPHRSPLAWLCAQPHPQRLFFRGRGAAAREIAAVGFAHRAAGPAFTEPAHLALAALLNPAYPTQRFYGATRFSADTTISPEWALYQGYTFVLPAVELSLEADGIFRLSANYLPDGYPALRAALAALVVVPVTPGLLPHAIRAANLTPFSSWDASMAAILSALRARRYDKIVLARRKRFTFHEAAAPSPTSVLCALDAQNAKSPAAAARSSYLFCLQLDSSHAFLGCTPERLFRLEGRSILTEALAGTVRRGADGNEGEVLSELLSGKNLEEHRFVVDYIRTALASCRVAAKTSGPHVRRLPRLMHLATDIRGEFPIAPTEGESSEEDSPQSNVYSLLQTMHPTPAVCGMPRERTMAELPQLEDFDRGFFAGPLGWFSRDAGEFCVAIRSSLVHGCDVTAFAGSGIVLASESKSEWDETDLKMSAFTDLFQGEVTEVAHPEPNGFYSTSLTEEETANSLLLEDSGGEQDGRKGSNIDKQQGIDETRTRHAPLVAQSSLLPLPTNPLSTTDSPTIQSRAASSHSISSLLTVSPVFCPTNESGSFDPADLKSIPNLNSLWGCCCVEELCRNGITTFFVAPGSRSAPLAVGVAKSRHASLIVAHDERGAGFLAVGYARATGNAAAVITSSGTAVANLLPAVVESFMDSIPLILLTADRPPELRDVGANQAISQPGIFGAYTRWSKDVPCPSQDIPLRSLLSDVDYAVHMSGSGIFGSDSHVGPVGAGPAHLNMMFREKLAPDEEPWDRKYIATVGSRWQSSLSPITQYGIGKTHESLGLEFPATSWGAAVNSGGCDSLFNTISVLQNRAAGVIIVGGGSGSMQSEDEALALFEVADFLSWPVIPDICSGLRFDKSRTNNIVHYADQILTSRIAEKTLVPDAVLQFGERITSKRVLSLIRNAGTSSNHNEDFLHVLVSPSTRRCDASFTVTHRIHASVSHFSAALAPVQRHIGDATSTTLAGTKCGKGSQSFDSKSTKMMLLGQISNKVDWVLQEIMVNREQDDLTEPWCARVISEAIARPSGLFIGNSMPIRDFDAFGSATQDGVKIRVGANRGASGIDGIVSSGIGFSIGLGLDVTIVLGDMSMIHDLNALHLLRVGENSVSKCITIVVVNNGGGGIFSMLPICKHRDVFSPAFDTPHSVGFKKACEMFGLDYIAVRGVEELRDAMRPNSKKGHRVIEALVSNDHASNAALHQRLGAAVSQQVSTFFPNSG